MPQQWVRILLVQTMQIYEIQNNPTSRNDIRIGSDANYMANTKINARVIAS